MSYTKIFDKLFIGGYDFASNLVSLKNEHITHIVCCADELHPFFPNDFVYLCVNIFPDEPNVIINELRKGAKFINDALKEGAVLVHCTHGITRSPTVVMAYMIEYLNFTSDDAFEAIRSERPVVSNTIYRKDLNTLEEIIRKENDISIKN